MSTKLNLTTLAEVKEILGITSSSEDAKLTRLIKGAESLVIRYSNLDRLDRRTVYDEPMRTYYEGNYFYVKNIPFSRFVKIEDFDQVQQEDATSMPTRHLDGELSRKVYYDGSNISLSSWKLPYTVTYIAGYAPFNQLDITDYSLMGGVVITFDTVYTVTEGVHFNAETSNEVTASNIVTALVAKGATNTDLEADGDIIRALVDKDFVVSAETGITLIEANVPEDVKTGLALIVEAMRKSKNSVGAIKSYTLGNKTVSYKDKDSVQEVKGILDEYFGDFISMTVLGV